MARKYGRRRVNAATCMAKAAELKTSAVTNWLVDWLLASESSDLQEMREGGTGEEGDVGLHWDVPSGRRRKGVVGPAPTGEYKREQPQLPTPRSLRRLPYPPSKTSPGLQSNANVCWALCRYCISGLCGGRLGASVGLDDIVCLQLTGRGFDRAAVPNSEKPYPLLGIRSSTTVQVPEEETTVSQPPDLVYAHPSIRFVAPSGDNKACLTSSSADFKSLV